MLDAIFIQFVLTICFMLMILVIVPPVSLKKLIDVCEKYSIEDEITYNLPRLFACTFGQSTCNILAHLSDFCIDIGLMSINI